MHIKIETTVTDLLLDLDILGTDEFTSALSENLVWIKVSGPYSELQKLNKQEIGARLGLTNFKLDLMPTDSKPTDIQVEKLTSEQVFDTLIDSTSESDEQKSELKALWRSLL
jgi:hypothetical protein